MNIGCDGRALVGPRTGVGTWTEKVMGGLARAGVGEVYLAATKSIDLADDEHSGGLHVLPPPRRLSLGPLWLNTTVPELVRRHRLDLWVGSLAILPLRCPVRCVAMVHDLTPKSRPEHHTLANRIVYRFMLGRSLRSAHTVVVGSAATEAEVLSAYPEVATKLERIGYGVDRRYSPANAGDDGRVTRDRFSAGRPYVLHLGTIEPRKGIPTLIAAWEELQRADPAAPDLVIAGRDGWKTGPIHDRIRSSPLADRIHLPGYVDRRDAIELLRHAAVFVLASEAEGFGLPLAEAISCGTPAVASDIPVLRETGGDAAIYCSSTDPAAFADGMRAALARETASALRRRASGRSAELRWEPVVAKWAGLLERVVGD
jgi:glycosyltransferase involved in cell wall biosynthesis